MPNTLLKRFLDSFFDNLKSKIQIRKWVGIVALVVTFAIGGAAAQAQQPQKVSRVGYLSAADPAFEAARSEAIRLALRELGYIEGQNIAIEYRYAEGKNRSVPGACSRVGTPQG
jgi:hypothetical protein